MGNFLFKFITYVRAFESTQIELILFNIFKLKKKIIQFCWFEKIKEHKIFAYFIQL